MKYNVAVIGLGSNIEPEKNIRHARKELESRFKLKGESSFVKTEPVGFEDQPKFINGAVLIETDMNYDDLKNHLCRIERELGRVRTENKDGPRTIDLDILVWNGDIMDDEVYERPFLKNSVRELLPEIDLD
jgi:2-amino-4-hydroxy-6-hydroxymethyldihydropteridine diphosphokinase